MAQRTAPDRMLHVGAGMIAPLTDSQRGTDDRGTFAVSTVRDGGDALDRLAQRSVDCLVVEYQLADVTGVEFLERVRESHGDIPVLMLTPDGDDETTRELFAAGATDCLPQAWATNNVIIDHRIEQAIVSQTSLDQLPAEARDRPGVYRLLVNEIVDYAIYMLDPDGHVVSWNTGAQRLKGFERDEILGEHFSVFYPHDAVEAGVPAEKLDAALDQGHVEDEGWRVRKDGSQFWAQVTITPLFDDRGELLGFGKIT